MTDKTTWQILQIDDDNDDYLITRKMLDRFQGRRVELDWASSYTEGARMLAEKSYDAVLVDYDLGAQTGIQLIRQFAGQGYPAPMILLTGRGSYAIDVEAMRAGANLYLTKDEINPLLLERSIRYAIERRQTEEALRRSEEKFALAFATNPAGLLITRLSDGTVLDVNETCLEMFGYRREEVIGTTMTQRHWPSPADRQRMVQELLEEGSFRGREQVLLRSTGEPFVTLASATLMESAGEQVILSTWLDITERLSTRAALQESETRFMDLANNIAQLAWMADERGRLFWYNQSWFDYTGTTLEEMRDLGWQKVQHPDHIQRVMEKIRACFRTGEFWEDTFPIRGKDGQYRWFLSRAVPLRDESGRITRWFGTNTDITEQRELEAALRKSEAQLREYSRSLEAMLDAVPTYMWITHDPQAQEITGNRMASELVDLQPGDNLSRASAGSEKVRSLKMMREGVEIPIEQLPVQQVAATGIPLRDYEFDVVLDGERVLHLLGNVSPLFDEQGQPAGAVSAFIDITPRKTAQEKLQESENRFRVALASAPISIYTTDCDLHITWMHDYHPGFDAQAVLGLRMDELLPNQYGGELVAIQQQVIETGQAQRGEIEAWLEGQQFYYSYYIDPLRDAAGKITGTACAGFDITRLKQAEQNLARYAQELERSNQSLQEFAFIASHDLQEPLRKIVLFGKGLQPYLCDLQNETAKDYLRRMQLAAERMQTMISALLDLSRINTRGRSFTRVELRIVAEEVVSDLEARIHSTQGQVIVDELPVVVGDAVQLHQLLQNLVANGLKYHREGVAPVVRVSGRLAGAEKQRQALIVVEDNGIGFDPQQAERIFLPFVRLHTRAEYEGTGMGLAICRKIVERHGGEIRAESQPGQGALFTVMLPESLS